MILYGKGFSEDDRRQQFTSVVYLNTILAMKALCNAVDTLAVDGEEGALKKTLAATAEFEAFQALDDHSEAQPDTSDI